MEGKIIRTKIWDTAGQERFRSMTDNFFKHANGVILVFDINCRDTYYNLKSWIQSIKLKVIKKNVKKIIIGNKTDLPREVSFKEGEEFANNYDLVYFETSAKTRENVNESIDYLISEIYKTGELIENTKKDFNNIDYNNIKKNEKKKGCC